MQNFQKRLGNKILYMFLLTLFLSQVAEAKVTIVDGETGQPLSKASIFDKFGLFIGIADDEGNIPLSIPITSYPLNIRYVGYEPIEVTTPNEGVLAMQESTFMLPEIIVDEVSRNLLYLQVYVRDYVTIENSTDTVGQYSEQIVDYVIPIAKKTKFKGWKKPRVLATKKYKKIKKDRKQSSVDTLTYNDNPDKYSPGFSIAEKFTVPEQLLSGEQTEFIINGKYGPSEKWTALGNNYLYEIDHLADNKDHVFAPAFLKLLGASASQTTNEANYKFEKGNKGVSVENLIEASQVWDIILQGKIFKKASGQKEDSKMKSYSEMYVIDRAYLTAEEAKELKSNPPVIEKFILPEGLPSPPKAMAELKEAVIESVTQN